MSGKINCVIVKDLSRFARNYSDAGSLIDNLFVQMGVRFISLAENVDSYKNPDSVSNNHKKKNTRLGERIHRKSSRSGGYFIPQECVYKVNKIKLYRNRVSVLDRLHIKLEERKQKGQPQQQRLQERNRKN